MYSREQSKQIRQEFWTGFGKNYHRKWLLYDTKIKELELKFSFNNDFAQVSLDIISDDQTKRNFYFEKIMSLRNILTKIFLSEITFKENYTLPEGKVISRIYVQLENVNIHNKNDWSKVQVFFNQNMDKLETFFLEYKDFIEE